MLCSLEICGNVDAVCSGSRGNEAPTAGLTIVHTLPSYLRHARNAKVGIHCFAPQCPGGFSTPGAGPSSRCQIILSGGTVRYLRLYLTSPHLTSLHFTSLHASTLHFTSQHVTPIPSLHLLTPLFCTQYRLSFQCSRKLAWLLPQSVG